MGTKIYAVIDTNVLVSALFSISGQSNPSTVVRKIIDGTITPLYNDEILAEYIEVLSRDKFPFKEDDIEWIMSIFIDYGLSLDQSTKLPIVIHLVRGDLLHEAGYLLCRDNNSLRSNSIRQ